MRHAEHQRHVHGDALFGKRARCGQTLDAHGNLDDHVVGQRRELAALFDHAVAVLGGDLAAHRTVHQLANLGQVSLEILQFAADPGIEARVGGDAGQRAPRCDLFDFRKVGRIEEELHVFSNRGISPHSILPSDGKQPD